MRDEKHIHGNVYCLGRSINILFVPHTLPSLSDDVLFACFFTRFPVLVSCLSLFLHTPT